MLPVIDPTPTSPVLTLSPVCVQLVLRAIHDHKRSSSPVLCLTRVLIPSLPAARARALIPYSLVFIPRPLVLVPVPSHVHSLPTLPARHTLPPFHSLTTTSARPAIARQGRVLVPCLLLSHACPLHERSCSQPPTPMTRARAPLPALATQEPVPRPTLNEHEH